MSESLSIICDFATSQFKKFDINSAFFGSLESKVSQMIDEINVITKEHYENEQKINGCSLLICLCFFCSCCISMYQLIQEQKQYLAKVQEILTKNKSILESQGIECRIWVVNANGHNTFKLEFTKFNAKKKNNNEIAQEKNAFL